MTGDHVTWADSPYIVTLKASDKRAGAVQAGDELEAENSGGNSLSQVGMSGLKQECKIL